MCAEDRDWFNRLLKDCIQEFDCSFEEVVPRQPVLYGDFMIPGADHKVYTLIEDKENVSSANQCWKYFKICFSVARTVGLWVVTLCFVWCFIFINQFFFTLQHKWVTVYFTKMDDFSYPYIISSSW